MTVFSTRNLRTTTAIAAVAAVMGAAPAAADVTAQEVWDNWKEMMGVYGESGISIGSESQSGDTLTVTDLKVMIEDSSDVVEMTMSEIAFKENGDGTVTVTMSEENPLNISSDGTTLPLVIRNEGFEMVVSGTVEEMNFALTADRYGLEATPGTYDDVKISAGSVYMEGIDGSYVSATGDMRDLDYSINAAAIVMTVEITEPGGPGSVVMSGRIDGLQTEADVTMPLDIAEMENPENLFMDGFSVAASYVFGASDYSFDINADGDAGQGAASAAGGSMSISMSKDGFSYEGGAQSPMVSAFGFEIPFPVEIAMDSYSYKLVAPLSKSDEPRDFALAVGLRGLTVNDILWSLFDPGEALPRDPATVAFDLTGKVRPLFDALDPAQQMEAAMSDMPAEIDSISLNSLEISAVGADVTGSGAFTFDNTDLATFDGIPRPEGTLTVAVNGANGLIDKLMEMGLLPQEQAMGARMMMGLFATPVGDDMLESIVEINDQGHVLANGQRLQ